MIDPSSQDPGKRSSTSSLLAGVVLALAGVVLATILLRGSTRPTAKEVSTRVAPAEGTGGEVEPSVATDDAEEGRSPIEATDLASPPSSEPLPTAENRHAGELTGRVLDPEGERVVGCAVELRRGFAREFSVLDLEMAHATERLAETRTDSSGEFRFELARGRPVDVVAASPGYVDQVLPDRYAGQFVEITLSSGYLVRGRVTRARDGSPVEDATVRVFQLGGPSALQRETETAADGSYELRYTHGDRAMLQVLPRWDRSSEWISLEFGADGTVTKDVILEAGLLLEGRVTDAETGDPIEGAVVCEGWTFSRSVTTDASGEYRFPGFGAPGVGELFVRARGYGRAKRASLPGGENGSTSGFSPVISPAGESSTRRAFRSPAPTSGPSRVSSEPRDSRRIGSPRPRRATVDSRSRG